MRALSRRDKSIAVEASEARARTTMPPAQVEARVGIVLTILAIAWGVLASILYFTGAARSLVRDDFGLLFVMPYLSGLIALGTGTVIFALRPRQQTARLTAVIAALTGITLSGLFDITTGRALAEMWILAALLLGGALIALLLVFPVPVSGTRSQPLLPLIPLVGASLLAILVIGWYRGTPLAGPDSLPLQTAGAVPLLALLVLAARLAETRSSAVTALVRDQSNRALLGAAPALLVAVLWLANWLVRLLTGSGFLTFNLMAALPLLALAVLSLAYAVYQTRAADTDRVVSQAATYLIMLMGLVTGYFLLVFGASILTGEALRASDPAVIAVIIFVMALVFAPVRTRLQDRIDRLFLRKRYDFQTQIEAFAQKLSSLVSFEDIIQAFSGQIEQSLAPDPIFTFLPNRQTGEYVAYGVPAPTDVRFAASSPLVRLLEASERVIYLEPGYPWPDELIAEQARLAILQTQVIVGLRGSNSVNGFVCLGASRAGDARYSLDELRFIQSLASQITVAVERTQVVESLERRVRELDVLSQVSQGANFTVELDDLLELIATQTAKLIDLTHFYIILRDPHTDELYYTFFMEEGERYRDQEELRWRAGRDLISEIFRTGHPINVEHYVRALSERGAAPAQEDPALRAWMGVPMTAGARVFGVLAAGTMHNRAPYNRDQLRIFSDIAALAATSLDKARLFAETNTRARQLATLNDISRQLVASELDLDRLLHLITASAIDMLDAEAGSLLLTDDDGGELEFKVVVGGSGQALVGSRVSADHSLAGEVAARGQPLIVNDVARDPRWAGELAGGAFRTATILAVPLVAQENVIGVLEVLNKREDALFTPEDAELLVTLAGQAAVVIENARLFQLTDRQLSERVSELEMLERIDVELSRSLQLSEVAEITVRYALANTNASAALLGVVTGDPARLEILHREGYADEDMPPGAEGTRWPLDRGIAARVMRFRKPELVADVAADPDYVPSLRGGLSQITLPMFSGAAINALLLLETNREPRFRPADLVFLQRLAEHASIAISNAQYYAELKRANQSKSEFVSFVAHELKNPLTSIKGYADVLITGAAGSLTEAQKSFLGTIRANAERMNTLVSDLNDVTKLQTDNLRISLAPVDLREVVSETVRPFQKQIEDKSQRLLIDVPVDLPFVLADHNRIIQVLTNLVSNAHKYTPPSGQIAIEAALERPDDEQAAQRVHICVRDSGIGMSQDDLDRLFTPYFRSENPAAREQPGTGLGLTITRGIIQRHNGDVWVESTPGTGTSFHFTLPAVTEGETDSAR